MLAGTVYFYDKNEKLIEKMDLYEYEEMNKEDFLKYIDRINATKVTLGAICHGSQIEEYVEEIYNKQT